MLRSKTRILRIFIPTPLAPQALRRDLDGGIG
jgi:hypothetical protein